MDSPECLCRSQLQTCWHLGGCSQVREVDARTSARELESGGGSAADSLAPYTLKGRHRAAVRQPGGCTTWCRKAPQAESRGVAWNSELGIQSIPICSMSKSFANSGSNRAEDSQ